MIKSSSMLLTHPLPRTHHALISKYVRLPSTYDKCLNTVLVPFPWGAYDKPGGSERVIAIEV